MCVKLGLAKFQRCSAIGIFQNCELNERGEVGNLIEKWPYLGKVRNTAKVTINHQ